MDDLKARLRQACTGHPHAKIPWPHHILHEAANALDARDAEIARLRGVLREIRTRPPSEAYEIARSTLANKETDDEG